MGRFKGNALTRVFGRKDAKRPDVSTRGLSVPGEDAAGGFDKQRGVTSERELHTSGSFPNTIEEWRRRESHASVARTVPKIDVNKTMGPSDLHTHSSAKKSDSAICDRSSVVGRADEERCPQKALVTHAARSRQHTAVSLCSGYAPEEPNPMQSGARRYTAATERTLTLAPSVAQEHRGWSHCTRVSAGRSCPAIERRPGLPNRTYVTSEAWQRDRPEASVTRGCSHRGSHPRPNANAQTCCCSAPYTPQPQGHASCGVHQSSYKKCGCSPTTTLPAGYVETTAYTYPCFDPNCQPSSCTHVVSGPRPELGPCQMSSVVAAQPATLPDGGMCTLAVPAVQATSVVTACPPALHAPTQGTTTTTTTTQTSTTTLTYQTITYPDGRSVTRVVPRDEIVSQGPATFVQTQNNQAGGPSRWPVSAGDAFLLRQHTATPAILEPQVVTPPMPLVAAPAVTSQVNLVRNTGEARGLRAVPVVIPFTTACSTPYFGVRT